MRNGKHKLLWNQQLYQTRLNRDLAPHVIKVDNDTEWLAAFSTATRVPRTFGLLMKTRGSRDKSWAAITFRRVLRFVHWATAWATATEERVKNTTWFSLGSGVRIVHVLSVAILPSLRFSLPPFVLRMKTCRARIYVVQFSDFRSSIFSSFSAFCLVVEHSQ